MNKFIIYDNLLVDDSIKHILFILFLIIEIIKILKFNLEIKIEKDKYLKK